MHASKVAPHFVGCIRCDRRHMASDPGKRRVAGDGHGESTAQRIGCQHPPGSPVAYFPVAPQFHRHTLSGQEFLVAVSRHGLADVPRMGDRCQHSFPPYAYR